MLRGLDLTIPREARATLRAKVGQIGERLNDRLPREEVEPTVTTALSVCRALYMGSRSADALPLAMAALAQAELAEDRFLMRRAATACGVLSADTADVVGGIEYHVRVLRLAQADGDRLEMSRTWNNIGQAMNICASYDIAFRCYQRALALVEGEPGPVYSRYTACDNLADTCFQLGRLDEGVKYGEMALREMTPGFVEQDLYPAILLRRNLVRLLVAAGRLKEAEVHVGEAVSLAGRTSSPRAQIAAAAARAAHELATGRIDIALTRLNHTLTRAREVTATLRDTLASVIRAEEAAGNAARALLRLEELTDHVQGIALERARDHLELSSLRDALESARRPHHEHVRARLSAMLPPPAQPEGWKALQRLGVSAVMQIDDSGWHGVRVGALTKALALANGVAPIQALEMGLAAEIHDIGLLAVPSELMQRHRAGRLSREAIIPRHVEAGVQMLSDDRHPRVFMAREIAKYHHARWDGAGYPECVGGKFIPLAARMAAVADAYDGLVCGYAGVPAKGMGEALDELRSRAGSELDPDLVASFADLVRSETSNLGLDLGEEQGMDDFHELVVALKEDRGFV